MTEDEFAIRLGERIRELRKMKGVSQLELAYDMEMSMNTISGIELGKISPKIDTLRKIALKLDVELPELFEFSSETSENKRSRKKIEEIVKLLQTRNQDFIELVYSAVELLIKAGRLQNKK